VGVALAGYSANKGFGKAELSKCLFQRSLSRILPITGACPWQMFLNSGGVPNVPCYWQKGKARRENPQRLRSARQNEGLEWGAVRRGLKYR
jgi:hypothetical protein